MLLEFKTQNFASIRDEIALTMVASNSDKKDKENENVAVLKNTHGKPRVLKSAVVYGANASGKSNLIKALFYMQRLVLCSDNRKEENKSWDKEIAPFLLDSDSRKKPTHFEVTFMAKNNEVYTYGFKTDAYIVHEEWLYNFAKGRKRILLKREENNEFTTINIKSLKNHKPKPGVLFITSAASLTEVDEVQLIHDWFTKSLNIVTPARRAFESIRMLDNEDEKKCLMSFLQKADFNINDITFDEEETEEDGQLYISFKVNTAHSYLNKDGEQSSEIFDLSQESVGTVDFFKLCAPVINAIKNGGTLLIDELEKGLHPLLTESLIKAFNCPKNDNSQLIFNTHDLLLLQEKIFRRDQVWFTEKSEDANTELFSLTDLGVRKDESFTKCYMAGKYGAVPFLDPYMFDDLFENKSC